jgi:molybdate-binding protein/DNA-binding transcriptional regulator YhcF (GntR family)
MKESSANPPAEGRGGTKLSNEPSDHPFEIRVDPWSAEPVYQQIVEQVRLAVAGGQLQPGDRLEPVRQLARRLVINASTVARSYQLLEHDGIIVTNRRGGSTIARRQNTDSLRAERENRLRGILERALVETLALGYGPEEAEAAFELQLAAWRERRQRPPAARRQAAPAVPADSEAARLTQFVGSHDLALEALWGQARRANPPGNFTARYVGSVDGLLALLHGEAGITGAHILDEETGEYNLPLLRRLFIGEPLCVMTLAGREQGLIVPPGNPRRLQTVAGLAQPGLRFVNRQPGSGTRTLLEHRMRLEGISARQIHGFEWVEATHLAVAAAVAEGRADAGLGLFAAARAYGLGFVPLARERYDLILRAEDRTVAPLAGLLALLRTPEYLAVLAKLGGYDASHTGEELHL